MSYMTITEYDCDSQTGDRFESRHVADVEASEWTVGPVYLLGFDQSWEPCRCPMHRPDLHGLSPT
jgi:hypothetical protein